MTDGLPLVILSAEAYDALAAAGIYTDADVNDFLNDHPEFDVWTPPRKANDESLDAAIAWKRWAAEMLTSEARRLKEYAAAR